MIRDASRWGLRGVVAAIWLSAVAVSFGCIDPPDDPPDGSGDVAVVDGDGGSDRSDASTDTWPSDTSGGDLGRDTGGGSDGSTDTGGDADDSPKRCGPPIRDLVNATGPEPKPEPIPWRMLTGGTPNYRKKTLTAHWIGVRELSEMVRFDCPPTGEETGLKCRTTRGVALEHQAAGVGRTLLFTVALPLKRLDAPEQGTPVRVTFYKGDRYSTLEIVEAESERPILSLRSAPSRGERMQDREKPQEFVNAYPDFEIRMTADIADPTSAYCLALDHCDRLLRVEPLAIEAESTTRVSPGDRVEFGARGGDYSFWHLVSFRRNQDLGPTSRCSDITPPAASYAFARVE